MQGARPRKATDVIGAAEYLGKKEKAIRRLLEKRQIPYRKQGTGKRGRIIILYRDLDAWLERLPVVQQGKVYDLHERRGR